MDVPLADLNAVASRLPGGLPMESEAFVSTLLDDASDLVRAEFADIDSRMVLNNPSADAVSRVVAAMVKRAYLAPGDGVRSQTSGPFAVGYDNPNGDLFLRAAERVILAGAGTIASAGARSVRMGY